MDAKIFKVGPAVCVCVRERGSHVNGEPARCAGACSARVAITAARGVGVVGAVHAPIPPRAEAGAWCRGKRCDWRLGPVDRALEGRA